MDQEADEIDSARQNGLESVVAVLEVASPRCSTFLQRRTAFDRSILILKAMMIR